MCLREKCLEQAKKHERSQHGMKYTRGLCAAAGDAPEDQAGALGGLRAWPSCWDPAGGWGPPAPWLPAPHAASASSASRERLAGSAAHAARRHRGGSTSTTCPVMQPWQVCKQMQLECKVLQRLAQHTARAPELYMKFNLHAQRWKQSRSYVCASFTIACPIGSWLKCQKGSCR